MRMQGGSAIAITAIADDAKELAWLRSLLSCHESRRTDSPGWQRIMPWRKVLFVFRVERINQIFLAGFRECRE